MAFSDSFVASRAVSYKVTMLQEAISIFTVGSSMGPLLASLFILCGSFLGLLHVLGCFVEAFFIRRDNILSTPLGESSFRLMLVAT